MSGKYRIITDPNQFDLARVHDFIAHQSYWAKGRSFEAVKRSIENSVAFGVFWGDEQIGLARVITDYTTFAYLADVYIEDAHRGKGLGKWLLEYIIHYPEFEGISRWLLMTADAHGLYQQYGFHSLSTPEHAMELRPGKTET